MKLLKKYKMILYEFKHESLKIIECKDSSISYVFFHKNEDRQLSNNLLEYAKKNNRLKNVKKHINDNSSIVVAKYNNNIIGYGFATEKKKDDFYVLKDKSSYLNTFFVDKNYRGKNIYPNMINILIYNILKSHISTIYISVMDNNYASIRGIEKCGFESVKKYNF